MKQTGLFEPSYEKINNLCFQPGLTQTRLYGHRRWLEVSNLGFKKMRDSSVRVAKTKALISCAVAAQLICTVCFRICKLLVFGSFSSICLLKISTRPWITPVVSEQLLS